MRADDARFLAMLARDGIPRPLSIPDAVAAAADVCRMVNRGDDLGYIESWMTPPHGLLTQTQAEAFVADSLSAYAPTQARSPQVEMARSTMTMQSGCPALHLHLATVKRLISRQQAGVRVTPA